MSCPGCEAREAEIGFLRAQIVEMQDRLLALTNPAAYQIYKGIPLAAQASAVGIGGEPAITDPETGEAMIFIGGQRVKRSEYDKAMGKLEEQMSGRSPGDGEGMPL